MSSTADHLITPQASPLTAQRSPFTRDARGAAATLRVSVVTLGCKVNQCESRALEESLGDRGHVVVPFGEPADAVVINTCTVTHRSDRDARALVRRARRTVPGARVVATGCYAQVAPGELAALGVDAVVGNREKNALPELLEAGVGGVLVGGVSEAGVLAPEPVHRFEGRSRAFLKVQDGCACFCAYCIVPYARGPSRSLPLAEVHSGLGRLRDSGHQEVVLTGVHLGFWGRDLAPPRAFGELLDAAEASGVPRVRLSSLEPGELTDEVVRRLAGSATLCPHLHVPLQSGSDRVLAAMGRPYTGAEFRRRVEAAAAAVPGLCLGLDVIAGFPGEDEGAFEETLGLLEAIPFAYLHVFPFSPRKGTRAWGLPDRVPPPVVAARARRLRELSGVRRRAFERNHRGSVMLALPEGWASPGVLSLRTRNYIEVRVPWAGPPPREEVFVRLERLEDTWVAGRCTGPDAAGGE
ncbi:MAG: tRNA (N(6)-L-threonylcarbamoyladenosine(37)-C(2))-methylthiotransferase MtaB [Deferrisomatales bacterium]